MRQSAFAHSIRRRLRLYRGSLLFKSLHGLQVILRYMLKACFIFRCCFWHALLVSHYRYLLRFFGGCMVHERQSDHPNDVDFCEAFWHCLLASHSRGTCYYSSADGPRKATHLPNRFWFNARQAKSKVLNSLVRGNTLAFERWKSGDMLFRALR